VLRHRGIPQVHDFRRFLASLAGKLPAMPHTPAYTRFIASLEMTFDKWHDGEGFDLDAIEEMTDEERHEVARLIKRRRPITWREIEALTILDPQAAEHLVGSAAKEDDEGDEVDDDEATDEVDEEEDTDAADFAAAARAARARQPASRPAKKPAKPQHSDAYKRFIASMKMNYEKWHEGEGYDVDAIAEMTDAERRDIVDKLTAGVVDNGSEVTWREVEALAAIDLPEARAAVDEASKHHLNIATRLAAAEVMHEQQRLADIDGFLANQIRKLTKNDDACTRALLMAEEHPSDTIKQALLWASWNQTECAPHCAALLCYLCGKAKEQFDWDLRPMFLKLDVHNSYFDRKQAFDELCKLVEMELDHSQAF
jgi:hypothetical protein